MMENVPYCNGAPHLITDNPALIELADKSQMPISGKDFKAGHSIPPLEVMPAGPMAKPIGCPFFSNMRGELLLFLATIMQWLGRRLRVLIL